MDSLSIALGTFIKELQPHDPTAVGLSTYHFTHFSEGSSSLTFTVFIVQLSYQAAHICQGSPKPPNSSTIRQTKTSSTSTITLLVNTLRRGLHFEWVRYTSLRLRRWPSGPGGATEGLKSLWSVGVGTKMPVRAHLNCFSSGLFRFWVCEMIRLPLLQKMRCSCPSCLSPFTALDWIEGS